MHLSDQQLRDLHDHAYIRNNIEVRTVPAQNLDYQGETMKLPNMDFSLGFAVRISEDAAITVNEGYLEAVHLTLEDIWQYWLTSTPRNISIKKMADIIASMCPEGMLPPPESLNNDLLVVYYNNHSAGSACVLHPDIQMKLLEIYPEGFNIIMSSIYEAIVTPASFSPSALTEILHEENANDGIVKKHEVATQYVYACHKPCEIERMVC